MKELKALTGLRAVAALWVLFFHSSFKELPHMPAVAGSIIGAGYAAVSLFFVLSGFILTYNYLPRDPTHAFTKPDRYVVARFARIYPVYIFAFILGAIMEGPLLVPTNDPLPPFWLNVLTFLGLQNWTLAEHFINYPSWSISCELFFYVTLPMLLFAFSSLKRNKLPVLLLLAGIVATAVGAAGAYCKLHYPELTTLTTAFRIFPVLRWPEFVTGVLLGFVYRRSQVPRFVESKGELVAILGAILAVVVIVAFEKHVIFLHSGGLTIPFAIAILGLAEANGILYRLLSNKWAILLGEASYTLYIIQFPVKDMMANFWIIQNGDASKPNWYRALTFFVTIASSVVVHKILEVPARRAIMRYAQAHSARVRAESAERL
jgi:peptidoglycan/LPS O-acetylase OafA/YrhL